MQDDNSNKILLPHHEQQTLCTTRLAYRQGRKLTAVKVYSITSESNHLLIFGVPSLNLRQETKTLFVKFGKLIQFSISNEHASETFTETYHAQYERIHSARLAKRMLDTKNFYGGSLHVCYAPELESVEETRQKLLLRQQDVIYRLKKLQKEKNVDCQNLISSNTVKAESLKLNMGEINIISTGNRATVREKRKLVNKQVNKLVAKKKNIPHTVLSKGITECNNLTVSNTPSSAFSHSKDDGNITGDITVGNNSSSDILQETKAIVDKKATYITSDNDSSNIEVIDCTGVDNEVVTNINESLNYNQFGNEIIKILPQKPTNKIQFHFNKKS